jgi:hypothetical protein
MVHVVHYGASRAGNIDAQFFILGWARCGFHKKNVGTIHTELVFFCSQWDLWATSASEA